MCKLLFDRAGTCHAPWHHVCSTSAPPVHACSFILAMPDSTAMDASDRVEKGDGDFVSGTDLARAWEGVPSVRRRAAVYKLAHSAANMSYYIVHGRKCMLSGAVSSKLSKVRLPVSGMVDREAIKLNEDLLELVIQHLGTRVSVDTLDFHIQSMYGIMRMSLSGT